MAAMKLDTVQLDILEDEINGITPSQTWDLD